MPLAWPLIDTPHVEAGLPQALLDDPRRRIARDRRPGPTEPGNRIAHVRAPHPGIAAWREPVEEPGVHPGCRAPREVRESGEHVAEKERELDAPAREPSAMPARDRGRQRLDELAVHRGSGVSSCPGDILTPHWGVLECHVVEPRRRTRENPLRRHREVASGSKAEFSDRDRLGPGGALVELRRGQEDALGFFRTVRPVIDVVERDGEEPAPVPTDFRRREDSMAAIHGRYGGDFLPIASLPRAETYSRASRYAAWISSVSASASVSTSGHSLT